MTSLPLPTPDVAGAGRCPRCGARLIGGADWCGLCHARLPAEPEPGTERDADAEAEARGGAMGAGSRHPGRGHEEVSAGHLLAELAAAESGVRLPPRLHAVIGAAGPVGRVLLAGVGGVAVLVAMLLSMYLAGLGL
jgi:hypothetical protein